MSTRLPEGYTLETYTETLDDGVTYYYSKVKKGNDVLASSEMPLPEYTDVGNIEKLKKISDDRVIAHALNIPHEAQLRDDTPKYNTVFASITGKVDICNPEPVAAVHEAFRNINNPATAALMPGIDMGDVVCIAENITVGHDYITVDIVEHCMGLSLTILGALIDEEPVGTVWNLNYTTDDDSGLLSITKEEVRVVPASELQSHYIQHHGWF